MHFLGVRQRSLAIDSGKVLMAVEIVYATEERQELIAIEVAPGSTIAAAINLSPLESLFPDESLADCPVGIWGRLFYRTQVLQEGDRIELYRALQMDPRDARRQRATAGSV